MTTSQTSGLSKPTGSNKISRGTLAYINARNRQRAYNVVIREFKKSGITQTVLAQRLGRGTDVISRWLTRPRNWELDTFSELLFGISGAIPNYDVTYPLGAADSQGDVSAVVSVTPSEEQVMAIETLTRQVSYFALVPANSDTEIGYYRAAA